MTRVETKSFPVQLNLPVVNNSIFFLKIKKSNNIEFDNIESLVCVTALLLLQTNNLNMKK